MRILLYTDVHFSQYSSILRRRGKKYSERLENIIRSLNWAEKVGKDKGCDQVICLGDFFDKPTLNDEELTALQDIEWNDLPHYFIVGNHESSVNGLRYNSVNTLQSLGFSVISQNIKVPIDDNTKDLVFIPYIIEEDRKPLKSYVREGRKNIIFSHNDIKGIRYGRFESENGFELDEIEDNCELFINGHLHNGCFLNDKETILNLGNLTGQNFSEDAWNYKHLIAILDTETLELEFYENPEAYNFYQVPVERELDIHTIYSLDNNAVVTFRCRESLINKLREAVESEDSPVVEYRILATKDEEEVESGDTQMTLSKLDYLEQFVEFTTEKLGMSKIVKEELQQVCQEGGTK